MGMMFPSVGGGGEGTLLGWVPSWIWWLLGLAVGLAFLGPAVDLVKTIAGEIANLLPPAMTLIGTASFLLGLLIRHSPRHKEHGLHFIESGLVTGLLGPLGPQLFNLAAALATKYGSYLIALANQNWAH
jgi:hypothetical protein